MGDFVEAGVDVQAADFVILNRVICCYPDMPRLAGAAAEHARMMLLLTFPNSRWWTRLGLTLVNVLFRVLGVQFNVFLHRPELILAEAERHGLRTSSSHRGLVWQTTALSRAV
jgi:hypothetical protein